MMQGARSLCVAAKLGLSSLVAACGGASQAPKVERPTELIEAAQAGDDVARCEAAGRADREVRESAGLGSIRPNIRRVYATIGSGEERRRVLLCREVDTNLDQVKDVVRTFNDKGESLREVSDSDYDGKVDTWITFAGGRMAKVDVDADRDGRPDEHRFYVRGKLSRLQRDTNRDGRADVWEIYEEGRLRRMGHDLDFDGHVDRWDRDEAEERAILERELEEERKRTAEAAAREGNAGAPPSVPGQKDNKAQGAESPGPKP